MVRASNWATGGSRTRPLPPDWPQRRRAILERDKRCRCLGCRHHDGRCSSPSTEVHHLDPQSDALAFLVGLCHDCHAQETGKQAHAWRAHARRVEEIHPALEAL